MATAFGPTGSGLNTVSAEGVELKKPPPNSTAPRKVPALSVLISSFRPFTRSVLGSVPAIEPESSMIASMLVAAVQPALACARVAAAVPPFGMAIAATIAMAAVATDSRLLLRCISLHLPDRCLRAGGQA